MSEVNQQLTHRQKQAQATRELIVESARQLFLKHGYGATTFDAISQHAGVAVSTVYSIFKNKRGILSAIREHWHLVSGQRELYQQALQVSDPHQRIDLIAQATRRQWETSAAMMAIYQSAAAVDPEAAAELQQALSGRRTTLTRFISDSASILRPGLSTAHAAAIFLSLTRPEVYQELVEAHHWTPDDYESWLAATLKAQLLP